MNIVVDSFFTLTLLFYSAIVNPHQNLRHIFSIFHLSECVIERITLSHIQGCISRRFHFDELQNNKRIRNQEEGSMGKADVNVNIWLSEKKRFANLLWKAGDIAGGFGRSESGFICQCEESDRENKEHEKIPRYHYEMAESGYTCATCK